MNNDVLNSLLLELTKLPKETEWVEFKENNTDPQMIGENISALSNTAALLGKKHAYLVWGVQNDTHEIVGTTFNPQSTRHKQQELESWLLQKLSPKINFRFHVFQNMQQRGVVILEIQPATHKPVRFDGTEFIRIQSNTKKLREFSEKERELWRIFDQKPFEQQYAQTDVKPDDVLSALDYVRYFQLLNQPLPESHSAVLEALYADHLIECADSGLWHITNLGAVLFARNLSLFRYLARKTVRIIQYEGDNKLKTKREIELDKGYALAYEEIISTLNLLLPSNEEIGQAFRQTVSMYPELALRELVANALIHQDFTLTGTSPMIEIFNHRIEITNPGLPLVAPERFMDNPPRSRNESIASLLRRMNICEERGSGVDKVVAMTEIYQLPAPLFEVFQEHTSSILFAYRDFKNTDKEERIRACYLHSVLKYLNREPMTNNSLRERFGIAPENKAMISRVIKLAVEAGVIKPYDENAGTKAMRYVPAWSV